MAKLQPEYPSIQDGAGGGSGHWADGGSCLSSLPGSPSLLAHATSLPMLHNFNIVFLLRLICMLSIHNGCHSQFTKPHPFYDFPLQMGQEISIQFMTINDYMHRLQIARSIVNPIFASFHVDLAMSYLFYCLGIWYWILVWHKAVTQREPCPSVWCRYYPAQLLTRRERSGEHVLVPSVGWLLKGWWGGDHWSQTRGGSGHSPQDRMGHVPLWTRYGSKDVIHHLVQFTKVFSITDLHSRTPNSLLLYPGVCHFNFWSWKYIYMMNLLSSRLFTPFRKGWGSCLDDAGILITNGFLLINLFNLITTTTSMILFQQDFNLLSAYTLDGVHFTVSNLKLLQK